MLIDNKNYNMIGIKYLRPKKTKYIHYDKLTIRRTFVYCGIYTIKKYFNTSTRIDIDNIFRYLRLSANVTYNPA